MKKRGLKVSLVAIWKKTQRVGEETGESETSIMPFVLQ